MKLRHVNRNIVKVATKPAPGCCEWCDNRYHEQDVDRLLKSEALVELEMSA